MQAFATRSAAAEAARAAGMRRILRVQQDGSELFVPVDGPPAAMAARRSPMAVPAAALAELEITGEQIRTELARGSVSAVPILLGAMLGAFFDRRMPWGNGYGVVLGALVGNAVRDGGVAYAQGKGLSGAVQAFLSASLVIVPLFTFGWGKDLTDPEVGSEGCYARRKIAAAGAAFGAWALLEMRS